MISFVVWKKDGRNRDKCLFVNFPGHGGIQLSLLRSGNRSRLWGRPGGFFNFFNFFNFCSVVNVFNFVRGVRVMTQRAQGGI